MKYLYLLKPATLLTVSLLSLFSVQAQLMLPPSPESMTLVRSVNYPSGLFHGVADITVPLFSISDGGIEWDVSVNYLASGIKVQDISGCVGLGWKLTAGGKITRVVCCYPDETGFCNSDGALAAAGAWSADSLERRLNRRFDSEPDVFYFEFGGRSGKFVFDPQGQAWTIPYQKIKIEWVGKSYFVVTDEYGTKYTFGTTTKETTRATLENQVTEFTSTWHLEKVETINGKMLEFTYTSGSALNYTLYNQRYLAQIQASAPQQLTGLQTINRNIGITVQNPYYVRTIVWQNGKLEFELSDQAYAGFGKKLDEIKIYSWDGEYRRSVKFDYSYFSSSDAEKRLKLDKIALRSYIDFLQLGRFEYVTDRNLPARNSMDFDHWGYYNAAANTVNRPSFKAGTQTIAGARREPDALAATACMLKRVYNMTGGYEEYEFESNRLPEGITGGLRLKSVKQFPGAYTTAYTYADWTDRTVCSGEAFRLPVAYAYTRMLGTTTWCAIESADLSEILGLNDAPLGYRSVIVEHPNHSKSVYTYSSVSDIPSVTTNLLNVSENTVPWAVWPESSQCWKRGLLQTMTDYAATDSKKNSTVYHYKTDNGVKKTINGYSPVLLNFSGSNRIAALLANYRWESQPVWLDSMYTVGTNVLEQRMAYSYDPNYLLPLETVRSVNGDVYKTVNKYPVHYPAGNAPESAVQAYALKVLTENNAISCPVEIVRYKNGRVTAGEIYEYKVVPTRVSARSVVVDNSRKLLTASSLTSYSPYTVNTSGWQTACDSHYKDITYADRYDEYGNMIQFHNQHNNYTSVVYAYNNSLAVAVVENTSKTSGGTDSRWNEVFYTSFEEDPGAEVIPAKTGRKALKKEYEIDLENLKPGKYKLTYWESKDRGKTWQCLQNSVEVFSGSTTYRIGSASFYVDEVSLVPSNSRVSTCSYLPGAGKLSETDYNGVTTYYEYDLLGRLKKVLNGERKPLKSYDYYIYP